MEWSGQKDFMLAPNESFIVDGKEAGVLKSHGLLSFLKVCIFVFCFSATTEQLQAILMLTFIC
jgi:hypothetical protein